MSALRRLLSSENPQLGFLSETKLKQHEMESVRKKLKIDRMLVVDCVGEGKRRKGGLVLFWKHDINIQITTWSQNHIDAAVTEPDDTQWRFTGIYGFPEDENKYKTGALLEALARAMPLPWMCGGDFNLLLMASEKKGGDAFNVQEAEILRNAMEVCSFIDMGFVGYEYTWSNNRGGEANIQERLDRFFVNEMWKQKFPGSYVSHLTKRKSDHLPLMVCVKGSNNRVSRNKKTKWFRFEAMWLRESESGEVVDSAWMKGEDAKQNIQRTASKLAHWSRKKFGNTAKEIRHCQQQMKELMDKNPTLEVLESMRFIDARMDELEKREEVYWHQRSRQDWLAHGDRNTAFFHQKAKQREQRNIIQRIKDLFIGHLVR